MEHILETMQSHPGMLGSHHMMGLFGGIILAALIYKYFSPTQSK